MFTLGLKNVITEDSVQPGETVGLVPHMAFAGAHDTPYTWSMSILGVVADDVKHIGNEFARQKTYSMLTLVKTDKNRGHDMDSNYVVSTLGGHIRSKNGQAYINEDGNPIKYDGSNAKSKPYGKKFNKMNVHSNIEHGDHP